MRHPRRDGKTAMSSSTPLPPTDIGGGPAVAGAPAAEGRSAPHLTGGNSGSRRGAAKWWSGPVRSDAWRAAAAYTAVTLVATWPLGAGLGRDVAWDLGDSLLNMWILAWDSEQLLAMLRGDFARLATFFDGNIFHPAPLTLAYSEHLVPQAIQALPVYAISGNPILAYNLIFLSTFVLSGLGTYLLVRELTGRPGAAFVAGLLFAFAPYRMPQSPHIQVLSSQWMPFALYGFRRYLAAVDEGRPALRPLGGAAAAVVLQDLSCGYYLLYFSPFAGAYVLWEIAARRLWRRRAMWLQLSAAALAVLVVTLPFVLPYAAVTEDLQFTRSRAEVVRYSADVHSYGTAFSEQPLWGSVLRAHPKPEGDLFPGFATLLLAFIGILGWRVQAAGNTTLQTSSAPVPGWRRLLAVVLGIAGVAHVAGAVAGLVYRRVVVDLGPFELQISNINQMLLRAAVCGGLLVLVSAPARRRAATFARGPGFYVAAALAATWLSLGPMPQAQGRPVEIAAPYAFLYEVVPGFAGLRVPSRFAMVTALMLAVLGGLGAAWLIRWRRGLLLVAVLSVAGLAESIVVPFTVNGISPSPGFATPEARVYRPQRAPGVYRQFAQHAPEGVLAELPLGEPGFDLRAVYYSTVHWRPLLNGYSGYYPRHYGKLALAVSDVPRFPDAALEALRAFGATHVIVHEGAYVDDRGTRTVTALLEHGALELYREGPEVLLELP